jgi:hypothetical protein
MVVVELPDAVVVALPYAVTRLPYAVAVAEPVV